MPTTPDGYYYIDDLDQPADMGAHSLADANAAQAVMDAHEAAPDPHPGYATDADLSAHVAAADPHPGYLTPAEGNAAYVGLTGNQTVAGIKTFSSKPVLPGNASAALEAVPKQQLDSAVAAVPGVPAGAIVMWNNASPPAGWLLCDGTLVNRAAYAALFAAIGVQHGIGDGVTTFALPNMKGRIPVALDASQTEFNTLGKTGGAKTHTLTTTEMPSHTHAPKSPAIQLLGYVAGSGTMRESASGSVNYVGGTTTAATGDGGAHNNLQPYIVLNFIIKT